MNTRLPLASILPLLICATMARGQGAQISEYVREVFQDRDGVFWFGTNGDGVCRYDGESLTYLSVEEGFGGRAVRGILQDADGAMWFATDGGVSRYESGAFTNYTVANGLCDDQAWCIFRDSAGTIWVGTENGVCFLDGESFVPFSIPSTEVMGPPPRFSPMLVWSMFEDEEGNLWFGTDGEGARKYDGESFTTYTTENGLAGDLVRCIAGDRHGRIWIGTDGGGVSCYDGETFRTFTTEDGLSNDRIFEMLEDRAGNLWFSTLGAGACRYDGESFTAFREDSSLIIHDRPARGHVQEFFEDADGVLWLGCSGGLFRLDGTSFVNVTRDGPWQVPLQEHAPAKVPETMASFARMVSGEWRVTYQNGLGQFDTWNWGPGKHSIRNETHGFAGDGGPWRELQLLYWHPGRNQVCLLGLLPHGWGVAEGTMRLAGETADAIYDLYQRGNHRVMGVRWTFDGPDEYHEALLEGGHPVLAEWDYTRSPTLTAMAPHTPETTPALSMLPTSSQHTRVFDSLVGVTWEAEGEWSSGDALQIRSTFERVPYADAVHARTFALTEDGEPTHLLDAYVYYNSVTGALRCLALSNRGGVHEGELAVLEGGALQLDLLSYEGERVVPRVVRFDVEEDGTLRARAWSLAGTERTLVLDVRHRRLETR